MDNRDLATVIWLGIFFSWALGKKEVRRALLSVLRAFFVPKISLRFGLMALYIGFASSILSAIGLWDVSQLKATVLWGVSSAGVMFFRVANIDPDSGFFKKAALDNFKITVLIEFFLNLYVFHITVELLLIPLLALIGGMSVIVESNEKYKPLEKLLNGFLSILGVTLLCFAAIRLFGDLANVATVQTLKDLAVPAVLSLMILPFIYGLLAYTMYESLFVRVHFFIKDPELRRFTKKQLKLKINFKLKALGRWSKGLPQMNVTSKKEVLDSISNAQIPEAT